MSSNKTISDIVDFNPKRPIKKGETKPFIEMAALPVDNRDVSELGEREFKGGGSKFKNGDTLFARITPCLENGKTAKVNCLTQDEHGHGSTEFIVMSAKEPEYDEDYVYYLARHPEFRAYAQSRMEGTSGRQRVAWQSLAEFEFDYPDKDIRKEAGKFLKEIDDKVALNAKTNQTLEQIAQALFKSWFVDFDPVKEKIAVLEAGGTAEEAELAAMSMIAAKSSEQLAELKQSKPDAYEQLAQTAELFPSAMQESELGDIPEGWDKGKIENIVRFSSERINVTELSLNNYISTENMLENKKGITVASSLPTGKSVPAFKENEILISNIRPYFKKIWFTEFTGGRSPDVLGFSPLDSNETEFAYNLLYQDRFFEYMMTTSKGAKMPRGDKSAIKQFDFPLPQKNLRLKFSEHVRSFYPKIRGSNQESEYLHALRDALLPELLSGSLERV